MKLALDLSLSSRVLGGGAGSPVPLLSVDRVGGAYKANGVTYASESLATASLDPNRVISGLTVVMGPVVVTGAREEVTNGTFDTDISGWAVSQTSGGPASQAWSAGTLQLTSNSALGALSQQMLSLTAGESYKVEADVTRSGGDVFFNIGTEPTYSFSLANSMGQTSNGTGHKSSTFVAGISRTRCALRQNAPAVAVSALDNATIKVCRATIGWRRKHRWTITAVAKSAPANNEVLLCLANTGATALSTTQEYLAIYRRSSDGHIIVEQRSNVGQISPAIYLSNDIGAVTDGSTFSIEMRVSNRIKVSLNGGPLQVLPASQIVNYPVVHIGKAPFAGTSTWTGTISSYQVDFPTSVVDDGFAIFGVGHSAITGTQSSPTFGATGLSWFARLCRDNLSGAAWYNNLGNGGATSQDVRDGVYGSGLYANDLTRNLAYDDPRTVAVIWACENDMSAAGNARGNVADIVNKWLSINSGGRFVVVEPMLWADGSHTPADVLQLRQDLRTDWGARSLDLAGYVTAPTSGGTSCRGLDDAAVTPNAQDVIDFNAGYFPSQLRNDIIHPNNLGMIPIANCMNQKFAALGYN